MLEVSQVQIEDALSSVGLRHGDGLLIHSAIQYFGKPIGGIDAYLLAILSILGDKGTIVAPTFNFKFAKGERYDPEKTPSVDMGVFSEHIRLNPLAKRTLHPMQSYAIIGDQAQELSCRDTLSAFDPGSAAEGMLELNFKLLLLGADIQAVSMLHYCEQRSDVPYRYWKNFLGEVRSDGKWTNRTYRMFVRNLKLDPKISLVPVQEYLQSQGKWSSVSLNYGEIAACQLVDFVDVVDRFLLDDPWSLVTNPPGAKKNSEKFTHGEHA